MASQSICDTEIIAVLRFPARPTIVIPPPGGAEQVPGVRGLVWCAWERAGRSTGRRTGIPTTTKTGTITFTSPDGVSTIELGGPMLK